MTAENLFFHHCSYRKVIEAICENLPHGSIAILAHALVVKPIHLRVALVSPPLILLKLTGVCVCVCVCVCVHMHSPISITPIACMRTQDVLSASTTHTCTQARAHTHTHIHARMHARICMCACMCVCAWVGGCDTS